MESAENLFPAAVEVTRKKLELKMQMTRKAQVGLRNAIDQGHKRDFKINQT